MVKHTRLAIFHNQANLEHNVFNNALQKPFVNHENAQPLVNQNSKKRSIADISIR